MARRDAQLGAGLLWASPWIAGFCLFLVAPIAVSAWYSLTDYPLLKPPVYVGLENYRALLNDDRFWLVVRNTALYGAAVIPLGTLLSLALAAALATPGLRGSRLFTALVYVPTLVPMMAGAMIWLWLFNARFGLINVALERVGVAGPNWLEHGAFAIPALVITALWSVGQMVVVYITAINEVPASLYEAARLDGMGAIRRFLHVTLPMISPAVLFSTVTLTIASFQVFVMPYVLFRNERGQRAAGDVYNLYLYDNAFVYQKFGAASAMAWMQLVVVLTLTGLMLLASKRLVHYRGGTP
ncbi:MAG TPA: sugar ABC transporter permease [Phycisphaerales bacterium]|nr:sugar ABC transporter permease [Phycisphaerales bacterium]